MRIVISKSGVPIRLTDERWEHVTQRHAELTGLKSEVLDALASPDRVVAGGAGESLAVREMSAGKWLVVVYREEGGGGFVITAFTTRRGRSLPRRKQLWP